MQPVTQSWRLWQKIVFRFVFILLGESTVICWDNQVYMLSKFFSSGIFSDPFAQYKLLIKPLNWLDAHIYHIGYNPKVHDYFPGDNHFGLVLYLTFLLLAIVVMIIWTFLDRKRTNYKKLMYWFNVYLRYVLAITMFGYGLDKLIPVQMTFPSVEELLTPLGEYGRFNILWNFMGVAPGYMMLTGAFEVIGSLMLFSRRTVVFGYLLLLSILINVVAVNIFYNIPVKMFSAQLLIYTLFLLLPYSYKLTQFFFFGKAVVLTSPSYGFQSKWKKYSLIVIPICFILLLFIFVGLGITKRYQRNKDNATRQKIYEVTAFVAKDTLPPLLTDTLRWKRFLFVYSNYSANYAVICNMRDEKDYYECVVDSNKKTFTLQDNPDTLKWKIFNYTNPAKDQLELSGKWKGQDVKILMKSIPIDSIRLNKEEIKFLRD